MSIVSVCHKCGTIEKSGRISCCGHGGSWFKNCGGDGNSKAGHTWYEGIQACKAGTHSKIIISHQLKHAAARQEIINFSNGVDKANSKSFIEAVTLFTFSSANTSTPTPDTTTMITSAITSASSSINECQKLINTAGSIMILLIIVNVC